MAGRSKGVVIPISAEDNSARAFESVNAQVAKLRSQIAAMRAEGGGAGAALGEGMHSATTQVQATSAALRTLEGNPGIRAMERFLVSIPGVGQAMLSIFPIIGLLAIGNVLKQDVEKFIEMREAALNAAAATKQAFQEAHDKAVVSIDTLDIQNDKLQEQLDKLEKHPNNGLQAALDDARKSCDELITSLESARKAEAALLKDNAVGSVAGFFTGVSSTGQQDKELNADHDKLIAQARKLNADYLMQLSGAKNPADVNALADQRVKQIHALFDPQIAAMKAESARLQAETTKKSGYGTGSAEYAVNNSKKIANVDGTAQSYADQEAEQLASVLHASLQGKIDGHGKGTKSGDNKAAEFARRIAEAEQKVADARSKADAQAAQALADAAKNRSDVALAQLEDQHKRQLVSDKDYYAQKLAIQKSALDQEEAANYSKQGALGDEIRGTIIKRGGADRNDAVAQLNDNARIIALQTQVNELEDKRADIVAKRRKLETQADEEAYLAAQKQEDKALKLAAEVEAIRGGSTTARLAQSDSTYDDARKNMVVQGASAGDLGNLDFQHSAEDAGIGLKGAEGAERNADSGLSTAREAVRYQAASGRINQVQAQQELIALDQQEAAAMQPVLDAYQKLAALGVDGAAEKVAQLKEKITELRDPVNQVAMEVSGQLNGAFEELFTNMDRGKKALDNFVRSIQSSVMKDTYKMFLQPQLQSAMGLLIPHSSATGAGGGMTSTSAMGGLMAKVFPGMPGVSAKTGGAAAQVTIINQSSTPVKGTATSSSSSDIADQLRGPVLQIMLHDLETGGSFAQAIAGGGLMG